MSQRPSKETHQMPAEKTAHAQADWIREMRLYFQRHGAYRPEDLIRLLGAPGESVSTQRKGSTAFGALNLPVR